MIITSDPPGAETRLDEQIVGRTPLTLKFVHYGQRRITLYLDGYLSHSAVHDIRPPWYARFPFDLFSEVLIPLGWKDVRRFHTVLEPGTGAIPVPDLVGVLQRAESLRRAGPEGPLPLPGAKPPEVSAPEPEKPAEPAPVPPPLP
jgi:PEGA domain-containing protein